ncbi:type I restriction modification DNA specificity domain protein [Streptococcus mitis]|uniref:Type I restriction modification DNA specificity domain protein n=1 Tax=Streptococcus mitis TaxID=28037 RepID=A0A081QB73_STRMT|nr:restriction endonuclease subunit S [Streptococcus mitis]KEQ40196.1 type I restriction modification DNA specificity domain protein [Streptococcus mitis]
MKNQNRKIPKIRFNRFNSVWEEDRIADIVKISAGGDVDKVKLKESGKYPVIANALTNKGIVGFYDDYKVKAPAVTVTGRGDVGYAVARHENFTPIVRLLTLQSEKIDVDYLENQINSMRILNESTGVPQLTAPQLGNYKVYHPKIEEQSAIGTLFRTLDDLLSSYKDNLANYQYLKATMLSKMFPKAGQTVPEIRLDGFEEEWEVQSLKELASFSKGNGYTKSDLVNSGNEIILYGQLYTNYQTVISMVNTFVLETREKSVISKGGEVVVPASGESAEDISRASVIEKSGVIIGGDLNIIFPDENKVDSIFLALTISNGSQQKELIKRAQGKSVVHLRNNDLEKVVLHYPSMEEQRAIGLYFSNLDNLINSYQEKITQLETLKKKLLQDMFI